MNPETTKKIAKWACGDDTGMSSQFLASCAIGEPNEDVHWPLDPSDFGRCFRLAEMLNSDELERALEIASAKSDEWKELREHWNELATLFLSEEKRKTAPLLYKRMKELGL